MNEDILVAILGLNEAEAFLAVEPLHGSDAHWDHSFKCVFSPRRRRDNKFEFLFEIFRPARQTRQAESFD
jgi:hypothetical protein